MEPFRLFVSVEGAFSLPSGEGLLPTGFQPDGGGTLLTSFIGTGEGVLRPLVILGELLVFLTGEGELWLLLRKGELCPPFFGDNLPCLVGVGVFLRGDGELLPLFTGEGELSRLPFGNEDL